MACAPGHHVDELIHAVGRTPSQQLAGSADIALDDKMEAFFGGDGIMDMIRATLAKNVTKDIPDESEPNAVKNTPVMPLPPGSSDLREPETPLFVQRRVVNPYQQKSELVRRVEPISNFKKATSQRNIEKYGGSIGPKYDFLLGEERYPCGGRPPQIFADSPLPATDRFSARSTSPAPRSARASARSNGPFPPLETLREMTEPTLSETCVEPGSATLEQNGRCRSVSPLATDRELFDKACLEKALDKRLEKGAPKIGRRSLRWPPSMPSRELAWRRPVEASEPVDHTKSNVHPLKRAHALEEASRSPSQAASFAFVDEQLVAAAAVASSSSAPASVTAEVPSSKPANLGGPHFPYPRECGKDTAPRFGALRGGRIRFGVPRRSDETPRSSRSDDSSGGKLAYLECEGNGIMQLQAFAKELTSQVSLDLAPSNPYIQALIEHREAIADGICDLEEENCDSLAARLATQRDALATLRVGSAAECVGRGASYGRSRWATSSSASSGNLLLDWPGTYCAGDAPGCMRIDSDVVDIAYGSNETAEHARPCDTPDQESGDPRRTPKRKRWIGVAAYSEGANDNSPEALDEDLLSGTSTTAASATVSTRSCDDSGSPEKGSLETLRHDEEDCSVLAATKLGKAKDRRQQVRTSDASESPFGGWFTNFVETMLGARPLNL